MTLPALGIFRHPEGKTHLVLLDGTTTKTMCTRHPIRNGEIVDPDTRLTCTSCLKGGWCRNFVTHRRIGMIFGGFNWTHPPDTDTPKPANPKPTRHYSCLWTYTTGNQQRQITCGHLHRTEHSANECAKTTITHVQQYQRNTRQDVQPAVRILAQAHNIKYKGVQQEHDDLDR